MNVPLLLLLFFLYKDRCFSLSLSYIVYVFLSLLIAPKMSSSNVFSAGCLLASIISGGAIHTFTHPYAFMGCAWITLI
jgi:hypothetical protein